MEYRNHNLTVWGEGKKWNARYTPYIGGAMAELGPFKSRAETVKEAMAAIDFDIGSPGPEVKPVEAAINTPLEVPAKKKSGKKRKGRKS